MAKKITQKDWNKVETQIRNELKDRQGSTYRQDAEKIWAEVDRQVAMKPLRRISRGDGTPDWRSAIELGELTKASEVWSADVRRLTFPQNRTWFEAKQELDFPLNQETGEKLFDKKIQDIEDGLLRSLMAQQHLDFGLKNRVDSSVKEALHHGSYVATVEWESILLTPEGRVELKAAPAWVPHSMWNCYPDPSTSIINNPFYQGSMLIVKYMPLYKVRRLKGIKDYPYFNLNRIDQEKHKNGEDETDDVELVYRYGDLVIERKGGDLFLPNCRVITANGLIIHYRPNSLPFPEIIFVGYEKLDIRDPYFVSPITKQSPWQKASSIMANQLIDSIDMKIEPPIGYNANDPQFVQDGGPVLEPGAKIGHKTSAQLQILDVGSPESALAGLQFGIEQVQSGTAVSSPRTGVSAGTEQTATEVVTAEKGSELRTISFVDKHELYGLRTFLYIQHQFNLLNLDNYPYYSSESDNPDFNRASKNDLAKNAVFEIVGSKGVLGEARRSQQATAVTAFWMQTNPQLLKQDVLALEMYLDAGVKNPERFLVNQDEQQAINQKIQQIVQTFQSQIAQLNQEIQKFQFQDEEHSLEIEQKELEKEQLSIAIRELQALSRIDKAFGRSN